MQEDLFQSAEVIPNYRYCFRIVRSSPSTTITFFKIQCERYCMYSESLSPYVTGQIKAKQSNMSGNRVDWG